MVASDRNRAMIIVDLRERADDSANGYKFVKNSNLGDFCLD
jgi:hypothetical protein